jgi:hypothetical protein
VCHIAGATEVEGDGKGFQPHSVDHDNDTESDGFDNDTDNEMDSDEGDDEDGSDRSDDGDDDEGDKFCGDASDREEALGGTERMGDPSNCRVEGCTSVAKAYSKYCVGHGGGRRCERERCDSPTPPGDRS